jgi:hypothetical protein
MLSDDGSAGKGNKQNNGAESSGWNQSREYDGRSPEVQKPKIWKLFGIENSRLLPVRAPSRDKLDY